MIAVVIPTYNRSNCIETFLEKCVAPYKGQLFYFQIHDSSESNDTKSVVDNFKQHFPNINLSYQRWSSDIIGDDKALQAIMSVDADYIWLCGEGQIADFNGMETLLLKNNYVQYAIINVEPEERIGHRGQDCNKQISIFDVYQDSVLFMKKYFSHLSYWGASIVSTRFLKPIFKRKYIEKYREKNSIPWWFPCLLCEATINDKFAIYSTVYTPFVYYNPLKVNHGWTHDERYYIFCFEKMSIAMTLIPSKFQVVRMDMIRYFRCDALVSLSYVLFLRSIGIINKDLLYKYNVYIYEEPKSARLLRCMCLVPIPIAKVLERLKVSLRRLVRGV